MPDFQDLLKSKFMTGLLAVSLLAVVVITIQLYLQKYEVDSEIKKLEQRTQELAQSNQELAELSQYFNTPEYREKEAREKLNLKKPGEQVVGLPEGGFLDESASEQPVKLSNAALWFNYFFR